MNVLVLHGPTLSFHHDLAEVDRHLAERARALGHVLRTVQSHHEGALVDALWEQRDWAQGVLLNPGPLALGSHVLREAVAAGTAPVVEVLTVTAKDRAGWVKKSLLRDVVAARVSGAGVDAYLAGLERLGPLGASRKSLGRTTARKPAAPVAAAPPRPAAAEPARSKAVELAKSPTLVPPKTLGRRGSAPPAPSAGPGSPVPAPGPASEQGKTLGRERAASSASATGRLTRADVRSRIADRLAGRWTPGALATWARGQWVALQQGAPVEAGQRELLDEVLQVLFLAVQPRSALGEEQLVEWMTALE